MKFNEAKSQLEKMNSAKMKADQMSHQLQSHINQLTLKYNESNALVDELMSKYVTSYSLINDLRKRRKTEESEMNNKMKKNIENDIQK